MKRVRLRSMCVTVSTSLLLVACAGPPAAVDPIAGYQHVMSSPSWALWFTKLPDLAARSDLALSGTVTKIIDVANIGSDPTSGILQTTYQFAVDRVLVGDKAGVIRVSQSGGVDNQQKIVMDVDDDPRFAVGETAVLFLTEVTPGLYAVQGGPSGRFRLHDGLVSAVAANGVPVKDVPLNAFATRITG